MNSQKYGESVGTTSKPQFFDCASRDETARGSAQDDSFYILQSLNFRLYVDTP
jgi:hypothetical protein